MNCRTARKMIADGAGNDALSDKKRIGLERHLDLCRDCRREAEAYRAGLVALKTPESPMDLDFTQEEWNAVILKAVAQRPVEKKRAATAAAAAPAFRLVFAYGLAVLLVGTAVFFGIRTFPWLVPSVETQPAAAGMASKDAATESGAGNFEIIRPVDPIIDPAALYVKAKIGASLEQAAGDVPTLTWISQETGLKIVWFVNDDIKMED